MKREETSTRKMKVAQKETWTRTAKCNEEVAEINFFWFPAEILRRIADQVEIVAKRRLIESKVLSRVNFRGWSPSGPSRHDGKVGLSEVPNELVYSERLLRSAGWV